ncbi:hypothetical protein KR059_005879, partial [Drosophila kikkawai]
AMNYFIPNIPFFSPEGRIYTVEYALEEVAKASPIVAILAKDGIVIAAELEGTEPLSTRRGEVDHFFRVDPDNSCAITGKMTDAYKLVSAMISYSHRHRKNYGELIPTERLVELICNKKQSYTMYIGKRPFAISVIYIGWDMENGWQLFQSDPSGNYSGWKTVCIGRNAKEAQDYLNKNLIGKPLPSIDTALEMSMKALKVAMGNTKMNGTNVQMVKIQRKNNITDYKIWGESQI